MEKCFSIPQWLSNPDSLKITFGRRQALGRAMAITENLKPVNLPAQSYVGVDQHNDKQSNDKCPHDNNETI